ncbi:MAG: hypothetical protein VB078_08250 [Clostridiaceae bacterium]|nr:hypothetical protein [Clostridiaceae bacterium]
MPRLSKKLKQEMAVFINPKTGKRQYNSLCQSCVHDCKQSYRASVVVCPRFCKSSRRSK